MIDQYLAVRKEPKNQNSIKYVIWSLTHQDPNQRMDLDVALQKIKNLSEEKKIKTACHNQKSR